MVGKEELKEKLTKLTKQYVELNIDYITYKQLEEKEVVHQQRMEILREICRINQDEQNASGHYRLA